MLAYVQTVSGDMLDRNSRLDRHEAEDREDDEAAKDARGAVDKRHDYRVPAYMYIVHTGYVTFGRYASSLSR